MDWNQLFRVPGPNSTFDDSDLGPIMAVDACLLAGVLSYIHPDVAIEYGSLHGHSASLLCRFVQELHCVEGEVRPGLQHVAQDNSHVHIHSALMQDWDPPETIKGRVGFVYIDASHRCPDSLAALNKFEPFLTPTAIVAVHDTDTWCKLPTSRHHDHNEERQIVVENERRFVLSMRCMDWAAIAFGSKTVFRHGLTFLQKNTGWE